MQVIEQQLNDVRDLAAARMQGARRIGLAGAEQASQCNDCRAEQPPREAGSDATSTHDAMSSISIENSKRRKQAFPPVARNVFGFDDTAVAGVIIARAWQECPVVIRVHRFETNDQRATISTAEKRARTFNVAACQARADSAVCILEMELVGSRMHRAVGGPYQVTSYQVIIR